MRKASIRTAAMRMLFNIAKTRNLGAAVFCSALVILGMQSRAVAQQVEKPGNLGENKGTGDPILRRGSWDLVKIEATATNFGHSINLVQFPRETIALPVGTLERKGISWSYNNRLITAEHVLRI